MRYAIAIPSQPHSIVVASFIVCMCVCARVYICSIALCIYTLVHAHRRAVPLTRGVCVDDDF
jgi:hypothetical protein